MEKIKVVFADSKEKGCTATENRGDCTLRETSDTAPIPAGSKIETMEVWRNAHGQIQGHINDTMTTAREFLRYAGVEESEKNLYFLSQYLDTGINFREFPDAAIPEGVAESADEPAGFIDVCVG